MDKCELRKMAKMNDMLPGKPLVKVLLLGALALVACFGARAEDSPAKQFWLDYNPSWLLSPKVTVGGDTGYRTLTETGGWDRLVLRTNVDYRYKYLVFKGGIGNFYTIYDDNPNIYELRPYQGVGWVWPRSAVNFDHLMRLEERFEFDTSTWDSQNSVRARYRLRFRYLFANPRPDRFWRAFGSGEIFVNLAGTQGLQQEQFRVTFGLERSFSQRFRLRLQTTWQQEDITLLPSSSADALYIRVRVFQNF